MRNQPTLRRGVNPLKPEGEGMTLPTAEGRMGGFQMIQKDGWSRCSILKT
jgi:hypothetical protein